MAYQKPKYRFDFENYIVIENQHIITAPPAIREKFEGIEIEAYGDWCFTVSIMPKPTDIGSLTMDNVSEFYIVNSKIQTFENYRFRDFINIISMSLDFPLEIRNYNYQIQHDELWDEQSHIFNTFKSNGLTAEEAQQLADRVKDNWELCKLARDNGLSRFLLPNAPEIIEKVFLDVNDGNFKHLLFENELNQIVKVQFATS